jgi:CBS domain-containing protein
MNAADVMTSNVISVRADASVGEIAEILLTNRISGVPVVDDAGDLIGIVSEGDLIHRVEVGTERRRSWWLELLSSKQILAHEFIKAHARKAADLMTRHVITVRPGTPLSDLASLLDKHGIKRVPVTENGKLVGIVSRANLVQALFKPRQDTVAEKAVTDSALRDKILAQLKFEPWWPGDVNVIVRDGAVELWGIVESQVENDAIRVAIEEISGVRSISNHISTSQRISHL